MVCERVEWWSDDVAALYVEDQRLLLVAPRSGAELMLPDASDRAMFSDGRFLVQRRDVDDPREGSLLTVVDVEASTEDPILAAYAITTWWKPGSDAVEAVAAERDGEGPLWRIPLDGGPPSRVLDRVGLRFRRLEDGRVVTILDEVESGGGVLVVIDPDTGEHQVVAQNVETFWYPSGMQSTPRRAPFPGAILYELAEGSPSGSWVVALRSG